MAERKIFIENGADMVEAMQDEALTALVDLISGQTKFPILGDELDSFKRYMLIIRQSASINGDSNKGRNQIDAHTTTAPPILSELFSQLLRLEAKSVETIATSTLVLMCLPHIRPINDIEQAWIDSKSYIINLLNSVNSAQPADRSTYEINKLKSFSICQGVTCLKLLSSSIDDGPAKLSQLIQAFDTQKIITLAEPWGSNSYSSVFNLQLIDFFLTLNDHQLESHLISQIVNKVVKPNISSPISKCRLFSLHIMTQLYPMDNRTSENGHEASEKTLFVIAYESEKAPSTIYEYRTKLRLLNYLNSYTIDQYKPQYIDNDTSELFSLLTFKYLLSVTYINFSLLWKPIIDLLKSYIENKKYQRAIITMLFEHLQDTNDLIYHKSSLEDETITIDFLNGSLPSSIADSMNQLVSYVLDRIDPLNHRVLVYQTMCYFPDVVEMVNKKFMEAFFTFADKELMRPPFLEKFRYEDLRKDRNLDAKDKHIDHEDEDEDADEFEDENEDEGDDDPARNEVAAETKKITFGRRMSKKMQTTRTFMELMKVLWNFKNFNSLYREADFKDLMLQLLSNRNTSIQHAAFRCILAYNHDYIEPYVQRIFRILSDRTFKAEIVATTLEDGLETQQSSNETVDQTIQEVHRPQLIPLIIRILYGKMIGKAGRKTAGRSKSDVRRSIVIRFIAGCTDEEIQFFLNLAFEPFSKYSDINYSELEATLLENLDISRFIPLGKLQAMLATLATVMELVANIRPSVLPYVLKIINISSFMIVQLINNDNYSLNLHRGALYRLKILRKQCYTLIDKFFDVFEYYHYSIAEINMVFDQLVWPMLPSLNDQSYAKPTPLLKLFRTWSDSTRFLPLLVKHKKNDMEEYPLKRIVSLYSDSKSERPVLIAIAKIFANLLLSHGDDEDRRYMEIDDDQSEDKSLEELPIIEIDDVKVPSYNKNDFKITTELDFGTSMLISSIPQILRRLQEDCRKTVESKNSTFHMEAHELKVLSAISRYVKDPLQSQTSASLLLTSLSSLRSENIQLETTRAIQVLMEQVTAITDENFVRNLAVLLNHQKGLTQRAELCKLLQIVGQKRPDLSLIIDIICLLNARSQQFIDSPDIEARLDGFKKLFAYLDSLTADDMTDSISDSLILVIQQTMNFITSADQQDFTTRDNCLIFYEKLAMKIKNTKSETLFETIVNGVILNKGIKTGLRSTCETIRHLYIDILRSFAISCHDRHKILNEFYLLCDERNPDLDFWINIKHIQLHNRSKALARLYGIDREKVITFTPKTLSSYILPIATSFLFTKTLGSLVDNSIKIVGLVCRALNWSTYESILTYYLENLVKASTKHQKTNVNLLTEILKNFNFDLTSCPEAFENREEEEKLEARIIKKQRKRDQLRDPLRPKPKLEPDFGIKSKKLNPSSARYVYLSVTKKIIPKLNSCLHEATRAEFEHDKQMKDDLPEKDEIRRIPISFAIVQLLNLLPGRRTLLRNHLPSIFIKLCSFLRSKSEPVRHASRATMTKVMQFLGPDYFPFLLKELKQTLHKGFQIHVLNFTIHSVLEKFTLVYGDLDDKAYELVTLSLEEIFGDIADDKEIAQILAKTPEAKKTKGYDTLMIVASVISHEVIANVLMPLRELLKTTTEAKKITKLSTCLKRFYTGLSHNKEFPIENLLSFIQASIEESVPSLNVIRTIEVAEKPPTAIREDRYIIIEDLPRDRVKARINEKGNYHFVVENSLRLLMLILEDNKELLTSKKSLSNKLNEFVQLLTTCLKSRNPKCVARALGCLYFIIKSQPRLPSLKSSCMNIVKRIFILLNNYNGIGMAQGDNREMIMMCFKTLNLLMIKTEEANLTKDHLRALLSYVDQDINDIGRQTTAFKTLKALLSKKLNSPELPEVMHKVSKLLMQSEDANVRRMSAQAWQTYLLHYPHGKNLQNHLLTFMRQLEYPYVDGRISTLLLVKSIISEFPLTIIHANRELLFLPLASRVVNEESQEARKVVSSILGKFLDRLEEEDARDIFDNMVTPWSKNDSISLRTMSVKLMSIFLESKIGIFSGSKTSRIKKCLDTVARELNPEVLEKTQSKNGVADQEDDPEYGFEADINEQFSLDKKSEEVTERIISPHDKHIYHVLKLYFRLLKFHLVESDDKRFASTQSSIWQNISNHYLTHWHIPVVVLSCQLYTQLLSKYSDEELASSIESKLDAKSKDYVKRNAKQIVLTLCNKYINLMDKTNQSEELEDNLTRSLVYLGKVVLNLSASKRDRKLFSSTEDYDRLNKILASDLSEDGFELLFANMDEANLVKRGLNFTWLSRKVIMQARKEVALKHSVEYHRRICVFKWLAAMSVDLTSDRIINYALAFLIPLARELTDRSKLSKETEHERMKMVTLAEQVVNMIKQLLGPSNFSPIYTKVQLHLTKKRLERKKAHAVLKVIDQARGIKRKNQQRGVKKVSKKRKMLRAKKAQGFD